MAQINLLKQKSASRNYWRIISNVSAKLLIVALLGLLVYYVWIIFKLKSVDKNILSLEQKIAQDNAQIAGEKDRDELLTRQAQLKELDSLISNHIYWSRFFPALAKVTMKTAIYSDLKTTADGGLELTVTLPAVKDLDKFLQVFDLPEVNQNFSDVKISSYQKITKGDSNAISFNVHIKYNAGLLKYQNLSSTSAPNR